MNFSYFYSATIWSLNRIAHMLPSPTEPQLAIYCISPTNKARSSYLSHLIRVPRNLSVYSTSPIFLRFPSSQTDQKISNTNSRNLPVKNTHQGPLREACSGRIRLGLLRSYRTRPVAEFAEPELIVLLHRLLLVIVFTCQKDKAIMLLKF